MTTNHPDDPELDESRRDFLRVGWTTFGTLGLFGSCGLFTGPAGAAVAPAPEIVVRARRELILFHGQSNALGTGGRPALTLQQIYDNVTFNGGVRPGTDPTAMTSLAPLVEYDGGHGTGGEVGTNACADGLVEYVTRYDGVPYPAQYTRYSAFTNAEGGRPIGYFASFLDDANLGGYPGWIDGSQRLAAMFALMREEAMRDGTRIGWLATTWQQGEADSTGGSETRTSYRSKLVALERCHWLKLCQPHLPEQTWRPLWLVAQVCSHNSYGAGNLAFCHPFIALAQRDACLGSPYLRMANPQYVFDYADESALGQPMLHLTNESHRWQGRYFARAIHQLIDDRMRGRPLRHPALDMTAAIVVDTRTIRVFFNVPVGALTLDTGWVSATRNHGFDVRDADDALVPAGPGDDNLIAAVAVVARNALQLTLKIVLPEGASKVTLGWGDPAETAPRAGRLAGPRTNVRDEAGDVDPYVASDGSIRPMHNYALVGDVPIVRLGQGA